MLFQIVSRFRHKRIVPALRAGQIYCVVWATSGATIGVCIAGVSNSDPNIVSNVGVPLAGVFWSGLIGFVFGFCFRKVRNFFVLRRHCSFKIRNPIVFASGPLSGEAGFKLNPNTETRSPSKKDEKNVTDGQAFLQQKLDHSAPHSTVTCEERDERMWKGVVELSQWVSELSAEIRGRK